MVNLQQPSHREGSRLLLVDSSVLPEVFLRVVEAKRMLAVGQVRSLSEAAKAAGISRSALYKYKDCVFVHNEALDDKVITLSARLEDRPGVLSGLLNSLSEQQGNILTVNQNIPVDGVAAVSVSARLPLPMAIETLRQNLLSLPGVGRKTANLILGDIYGKDGYVCDTHCIRITGRLGLTDGSRDPVQVERQLRRCIPPEESSDFCHRMVLHGRAVCMARRPDCGGCTLRDLCDFGKAQETV